MLRPIYRFRGDEKTCRARRHEANLFLEEMLLGSDMATKQDTYAQHKTLPDGSRVWVRKAYGRPIVTIWSPGVVAEEEEVIEGFVQHPQYIYAHVITGSSGSFEALATVYNCRSKGVAEKTENPDYGLKDTNGDLLYPYAPQYWGIKNPYYGLLKAGVSGSFNEDTPSDDLLFPDATEYFTFPRRVLITSKERDVIFLGAGGGYYYNNPAGTWALKVYTGTKDTRLGGFITGVTFVNKGTAVRVGNTIDIPAQQQYQLSTRSYVPLGSGGRIEITGVTSDGKVSSYKLVSNGTGYVTSAEVLDLQYKGITVTLEAAPADETLHFHTWYTTNCRDGNVQVSRFMATTDRQIPALYPWLGFGKDHLGVALHAVHTQDVDAPYPTITFCDDIGYNIHEANGTTGHHWLDTWTTTLYEPDQLREVHQIGILEADYNSNENIIISAEKEDKTDDKLKVVNTCTLQTFTPEADGRASCGDVTTLCGPYNWPPPKQPDFNNCVAALAACYYQAMNGKETWRLDSTYRRSADDNFLKLYDKAIIYDPIAHETANWDGSHQTWAQNWDKMIRILLYVNQYMPYRGLGGFRYLEVTGYTKGESTFEDSGLIATGSYPADRYYWIINSDTLCMWMDSGISGDPLRWTSTQDRWRLVYNSRYSDATDTPKGGLQEKVGPYFMQLYVYAYSERKVGQQSFLENPTGLEVHASIINVDPTVCFYQNGDGETGLTYAANDASASGEFEAIIAGLIAESGALSNVASVNASFLSYKTTRTMLIDRAEGQVEDETPTGQDPDEV